MSSNDQKEMYSKASKYYVENQKTSSKYYDKSKNREKKHNADWEKNKVNINEIIDKFAPDFHAVEHNEKLIFYGKKYNVITDLASGYLRIYDNKQKAYVDLDGNPGNNKETHYKIKKREEM